MAALEKLHVGVVGAVGRASGFTKALQSDARVQVTAVCDITEEKLIKAGQLFSARDRYLHYEEMIERAEIDAVIIGTPMHFHADQSVIALERNLHVISEVTPAVTIDECQRLVKAAHASKGSYLLAENCNYIKELMIVKQMVRDGLFGELYFAEGEYLHELKELNEITAWRRVWQTGMNGITYGTHSLGPILGWMDEDRITTVSCTGSGHHYSDRSDRRYEQEDTCVMLAKTAKNRLIKVRLDMLSERPYALNYTLQGTKGCYESSRFGQAGKVSLQDSGNNGHHWKDIRDYENKYLPDIWRSLPDEYATTGHGGTDYVMMRDFLNALVENSSIPIDIHRAMDMTLPGLFSQESIRRQGEWLQVPDSRAWS